MVFQEPMSSLNPCYPVGWQIAESTARASTRCRARRCGTGWSNCCDQVGIPAPATRLRAFPHQLSGGMNQRVMIAMAIACNPRLLIADEPTTALDVTIQKQILDLLVSLQRERGMALVLITHDMGVVAETAQRVQVMYAGQMVEEQPTDALFAAPRHPYTAALLDALPERAVGRDRLPTIPGMVPGIDDRPPGCLFNPRCRFATDRCLTIAAGAGAGAGGARALPLPARRRRPADRRGACMTTLMQARDVSRHYPVGGGLFGRKAAWCARWTASRSTCARARRWRWSANPAAASPPWPGWPPCWSRRPAATC